MLLADINKLSVAYGADIALYEISLRVGEGDRIGLIGRNGEGKSTLLEVIVGNIRPDSGRVTISSKVSIAYLRQHQSRGAKGILFENVLSVFSNILEIRHRLKELEEELAEKSSEKLLMEYGVLLDEYQEREGELIERRTAEALIGLGFNEDDFRKPFPKLSGGQKNRAALANVLLSRADLLLLDEPTNHLDLNGIEFLEKFLNSFTGGAIIISHDRTFLDNISTDIAEIRRHKLYFYSGVNYSSYLPLKETRIEGELKRYRHQQEEIRRQKEFIRRNIMGQKTKQAQSRRRMLNKMKRLEKPDIDNSVMKPVINDIPRSGLKVLEINSLGKSFGSNVVFKGIDLELIRGEAAGIIGPNACGKSTLLKIINGELSPDEGEIHIGANVSIGYYSQHRDDIDYSRTILDQVWDLVPNWEEVQVRSYLGRFLFSGDEPLRKASSLSGGEAARLALAMLFLHRDNCLIMDEPTNHLDITSREVLEETLSDFPGTLLLVSHDRYFLNGIVDKIYAFENGNLHYYAGNYDYYLQKKKEMDKQAKLLSESAKRRSSGKSLDSYLKSKEQSKKRQRLKKIEAGIERCEDRIRSLKIEMESEQSATDWEKLANIEGEIRALEKELMVLLEQWEKIQGTP